MTTATKMAHAKAQHTLGAPSGASFGASVHIVRIAIAREVARNDVGVVEEATRQLVTRLARSNALTILFWDNCTGFLQATGRHERKNIIRVGIMVAEERERRLQPTTQNKVPIAIAVFAAIRDKTKNNNSCVCPSDNLVCLLSMAELQICETAVLISLSVAAVVTFVAARQLLCWRDTRE